MDEALGQLASFSPPCPIASIPEDKPGPSATQALRESRGKKDEEEEEEEESDGERARQRRGRKRRREREDPFLALLKEDLQYQREADERRAAEARERANRFFALLERLAEK